MLSSLVYTTSNLKLSSIVNMDAHKSTAFQFAILLIFVIIASGDHKSCFTNLFKILVECINY